MLLLKKPPDRLQPSWVASAIAAAHCPAVTRRVSKARGTASGTSPQEHTRVCSLLSVGCVCTAGGSWSEAGQRDEKGTFQMHAVPPNIAELKNLEVLNFFNNQIEELPTQISSLQKLKHLNLGMNRLNTLPRGFGSLPALEVLDLTYNNLNENSLPGNFFYLTTLRALYLSDNDFEILPPDIGKLTKLQILSLRDNDLISLPKEIGELTQLKELHIQGNRLTVLPPELEPSTEAPNSAFLVAFVIDQSLAVLRLSCPDAVLSGCSSQCLETADGR
ncbi:hypothetical protein J1605_009876 [Eschrichtius robustus]|uniref:Disease resistance R13L4/SHOC-2-like LRR domain-containing protein n=1 Tax=Eschrichtius robustus TaxID=9764 RepID=A0AB34GWL3_ESCRO|nr:hypothetical protein J1605_009876 [Eschrichtius robustus]